MSAGGTKNSTANSMERHNRIDGAGGGREELADRGLAGAGGVVDGFIDLPELGEVGEAEARTGGRVGGDGRVGRLCRLGMENLRKGVRIVAAIRGRRAGEGGRRNLRLCEGRERAVLIWEMTDRCTWSGLGTMGRVGRHHAPRRWLGLRCRGLCG